MSARDLGYRLLGRGFDYLLHLRPAEWPIMAVHLLTGSALAIGLAGILEGSAGWALWAGAAAFVVGINGGTLALNSAFDRDEGDVAYLRRPPPPPRGLAHFGLLLMTAALGVALALPVRFLLACAICAALSVAYSVPPLRLKAAAGFDWAINMAGFGFLTPYAGWALTGREVAGPGLVVLIAFAFLFGSLYPLTQLYQVEEDSRRGDRTLAVRLGIGRSLAVALAAAALAFGGFVAAGLASGWRGGDAAARWAALALAAAAWLVVLVPWWRRHRSMDPGDHQTGMHRALAAWAITDMAVLFAWAR